ncbi:hypothetical protein ACJX0J_037653 [Zea mays]
MIPIPNIDLFVSYYLVFLILSNLILYLILVCYIHHDDFSCLIHDDLSLTCLCSSKSSIVYLHINYLWCFDWTYLRSPSLVTYVLVLYFLILISLLHISTTSEEPQVNKLLSGQDTKEINTQESPLKGNTYAIVFVDFVTQVYRLYCNYLIIGTGASLPFPLVSALMYNKCVIHEWIHI